MSSSSNGVIKMSSSQDLIEKAKIEIKEEVEFFPASTDIETEMQVSGEMARYDFNHDIIYYSSTLINNRAPDYQIQTFMHELAHAKDLRCCATNGLIKILMPRNGVPKRDLEKVNEDLHAATEFQISNFLNSKFHFTLPQNPQTYRDLSNDLFFSLIPSIEYLYFGEEEGLKEQFKLKLDKKLDKKWLSVASLLNTLDFADSHLFEKEFVKITRCFGYNIQIKIESINEELRKSFKILQNNNVENIKIFELIDFDFRRSIFYKPD